MSCRKEGGLDIMRSADAEPNIGKASSGHDCYRLSRVADRSADHELTFLERNVQEGERGSDGLITPVAIEGALVLPARPDDSSEPVGECDGGFVVTARLFTVQRPSAQRSSGLPARCARWAASSAERAPWTRSVLQYTSPCLEILPKRRRSALDLSLGVRPSQQAK